MKCSVLLAVLLLFTGGVYAAGAYDPLGVDPPGPGVGCLSINLEAIETLADSRKRSAIVYMAPFACPPCEATQLSLGGGDDEVSVTYHPGGEADFTIAAYPAIFLPDCRRVSYGKMDLPTLKAMLKSNPPTRPPQFAAVTVGTIKGRAALETILKGINSAGQGTTVELGSASVVLPLELTCSLSLKASGVGVSFPAAKPRIRLGSGWFSVARDVSHIRADQSAGLLTVGVVGFPDLVFVLE